MIEIFSIDYDKVIDSKYLTGRTTYKVAVEQLYPLINKYDSQRKIQPSSFYARLRKDIVNECIMPSLTVAFLADNEIDKLSNTKEFEKYISENISKAYILDGIQRLNALFTVSEEKYPENKFIYINFIIAKSQDYLLYRMITLNNGQKQMTPRHQIEILTKGLFNFDNLNNIKIFTEKETANSNTKDSFQFAAITKAYLSFLTEYVNTENAKIISEQMDKIIVNKIMDKGIDSNKVKFQEFLSLVDKLCINPEIKKWFRLDNNLIGFAAIDKAIFELLKEASIDDFLNLISNFEEGFSIINKSKIKVGQTRRELVQCYFNDYNKVKDFDLDSVNTYFNDKSAQ